MREGGAFVCGFDNAGETLLACYRTLLISGLLASLLATLLTTLLAMIAFLGIDVASNSYSAELTSTRLLRFDMLLGANVNTCPTVHLDITAFGTCYTGTIRGGNTLWSGVTANYTQNNAAMVLLGSRNPTWQEACHTGSGTHEWSEYLYSV